jgi:hypothetical protein
MTPRPIVSPSGALIPTAAIAGPSLGAAPTFTGSLWCTSSLGTGDFTEILAFENATRKEINEAKKMPAFDICVKGTIVFIATA